MKKYRKCLPAMLISLTLASCAGGGYQDSHTTGDKTPGGGSAPSTYQSQPGPDFADCLQTTQGRSRTTGSDSVNDILAEVDRLETCGLEQADYADAEGDRYQAYMNQLATQCQNNNPAACAEWRDRAAKQAAHEDRMLEQMRLNHSLRNRQN